MDIEIKKLEDFIRKCNASYAEGIRLVSDEEYDSALEELRKIDPENELCSKVQQDTIANSKREKFDFGDKPMLSLNKVYSIEDLIKWMRSVSRNENEAFLLQPKYDGLSGCIDGDFMVLSTRGDGHTGEVLHKVPMIKFEKWTKDYSGSLDSLTGCVCDFNFPEMGKQIRGELILRNDKFDEFKSVILKKDGGQYKNTRNAVSGLMNSASNWVDDRKTADALRANHLYVTFIDHNEISERVKISDANLASKIEQTWDFYLKHLPYDQDGLVIKLADNEYAESLGNTEHHPRGAIALKKNVAGKWSKLLNIEWTVGMNGELTPTAVIEPIEL